MTRYNIFGTLISSVAILAAVGCGDPSADRRSVLEGAGAIDPSEGGPEASIEEEVELACDSSCNAMQACPSIYVTTDCVERCVATYAVESEECALGAIDLLNCLSALSCASLPLDVEGDCADSVRVVDATCGAGESRVRVVPDSERERSVDEAPGSVDDSGDEDSAVTDITDPVVIAEIPDPVVVVDFGTGGASDAE